jgi:hypothetical protein
LFLGDQNGSRQEEEQRQKRPRHPNVHKPIVSWQFERSTPGRMQRTQAVRRFQESGGPDSTSTAGYWELAGAAEVR